MKKALKWVGIILGVFVGLVVLFLTFAYFNSEGKLNARYESIAGTPVTGVTLSDSALVARGHYLTTILGCNTCHGENYAGQTYVDAPPFQINPPNLTSGRGGVGQHYDADEWERAIRHGISYDHRSFFMMPSADYANLSDEDMAAIAAFLETLPPVDNELPPPVVLRPLGRVIVTASGMKSMAELIDHTAAHPTTVRAGATADYGKYLASLTCMGCHGQDLEGGPSPDPAGPEVPSLSASSAWSVGEFHTAMRTGQRPGGVMMDEHFMPWPTFGRMSNDEITAIHLFLQQRFDTAGATASN